eukprot:11170457-Lingulodinium_polyedra.AAC.1
MLARQQSRARVAGVWSAKSNRNHSTQLASTRKRMNRKRPRFKSAVVSLFDSCFQIARSERQFANRWIERCLPR